MPNRFAFRWTLALLTSLLTLGAAGCGPQEAITSTGAEPLDEGEARVENPCQQNFQACDLNEPPQPTAPRITARTKNGFTVAWSPQSGWISSTLERMPPNGAWVTERTTHVTTVTQTHTDADLSPDTIHCYRVKAMNVNGTRTSPVTCGVTRHGGIGDVAFNRLQLKVKTSTIEDAGSDDRVSVSLSQLASPGRNLTHLNYEPKRLGTVLVDDFDRGLERTYDLDTTSLLTLRDVTSITLSKVGTDGLCVSSLELLVNGKTAFTKNFGNATCRWIDGNDGHQPSLTVPFAELRAQASFSSYEAPPVQIILSAEEFRARLEGIIGNAIGATGEADWYEPESGPALELSVVDDNSIFVDLDLQGIADNSPDAEIDIDFHLDLGFERNAANDGWNLVFDVSNYHLDTDVNFIPGNFLWAEDKVVDRVNAGFDLATRRMPLVSDKVLEQNECVRPTVTVLETDAGPMLFFACTKGPKLPPIKN